ncbi:MAG: PfkB family carbohydrate kinase [Deltaproteobacteria bacterium]|nr:PfkB family carbohydrate kinase [Deltaproteobacteria bacterium]
MPDFDVLCVGATSYDLVFRVDHHPGADEKAVAESFVRCGGGPAANAAIMVARMGLRSAFAGYLGADLFGGLHLQELKSAGVDTRLVVRGEHPTPISSVWVKPSGEKSLVNFRSAESVLSPGAVDFTDIRPRVILFDGHEPELSVSLLDHARVLGIKTVLDAGSWNRGTSRLFDKVDYLVCSETFARQFAGTSSPRLAMEELIRRNGSVVITLGREGLIWRNPDGAGSLPAFPVTAEDTTGAGDVFHGAFAGSIAVGREWGEALRYASAAAALSCTRLGARIGIPEGAEVERFLHDLN